MNNVVDKRLFSILQSRRKHFFILLGLCFFFYPILLPIRHMKDLCTITAFVDHTSYKIDMFAKAR